LEAEIRNFIPKCNYKQYRNSRTAINIEDVPADSISNNIYSSLI